MTINELREFAAFRPAEQRYIKRSLDIGLGRQVAFKLWARDASELASTRSQYIAYQDLKALRSMLPDEISFEGLEGFMGKLVRMTAFDLAQDRLSCFSACLFLYERLAGAKARPWLPSAFYASSALPQIHPQRRKMLLHSISEAAATAPDGWIANRASFRSGWKRKQPDWRPPQVTGSYPSGT